MASAVGGYEGVADVAEAAVERPYISFKRNVCAPIYVVSCRRIRKEAHLDTMAELPIKGVTYDRFTANNFDDPDPFPGVGGYRGLLIYCSGTGSIIGYPHPGNKDVRQLSVTSAQRFT